MLNLTKFKDSNNAFQVTLKEAPYRREHYTSYSEIGFTILPLWASAMAGVVLVRTARFFLYPDLKHAVSHGGQ